MADRSTDLKKKWSHHLELQAEIELQGVWHGLDLDPVSLVGDLEARDHARKENGDEIPVAVRRQTQRPARVRARREVVDIIRHAAADDPDEEVWPEAQALAQHAQDLHGHTCCQRGVVPNNFPACI